MERLREQTIALTERTWCKKYLDPDRIRAYPEDKRSEHILDSLGKYQNRRTSRVLQNMDNVSSGNDKIAVFAYYLRESGFSDALNDAEQECVAYGFEHRIDAITSLFVSACQRPPGPETMAAQLYTMQ
jgi:hypothetical protein